MDNSAENNAKTNVTKINEEENKRPALLNEEGHNRDKLISGSGKHQHSTGTEGESFRARSGAEKKRSALADATLEGERASKSQRSDEILTGTQRNEGHGDDIDPLQYIEICLARDEEKRVGDSNTTSVEMAPGVDNVVADTGAHTATISTAHNSTLSTDDELGEETILETSAIKTIDDILEELKCKRITGQVPHTYEIPKDPVAMKDGYYYEKLEMEKQMSMLEKEKQILRSPETGNRLRKDMYPADDIRKLILDLREKRMKEKSNECVTKEDLSKLLLDHLCCGITKKLPANPVSTDDGHIYDQEALDKKISETSKGSKFRSPTMPHKVMDKRYFPAIRIQKFINFLVNKEIITDHDTRDEWKVRRKVFETKESANNGDEEEMCRLGQWYEKGQMGLERDLTESYNWYKKGAERRHPPSMYKAGDFLASGKGVEADVVEGVMFMTSAAELGFRRAFYKSTRWACGCIRESVVC